MSAPSGGGVHAAIVERQPIAGGTFIAVVGPSGAGKDSIIDYARRILVEEPRVHFVRRVVTRLGDPTSEDHDSTDDDAFDRQEAAGAYALSWSSHGLRYGIPVEVDEAVRSGAVVIANLSRGVVAEVRRRYDNSAVVMIGASPEALRERLRGRGRETEGDIALRLARNAGYAAQSLKCETIDNSGPLHHAGDRFLALIRSHLTTRTA
jgi:ribose 1,5-bisphosphokinase